MKNPLIVFTCALGALWSSCAGLADRDRETGPDSLSVTFAVTVPETETVTRALSPEDERQVRDLNIYLFHKTTDIRKHLFSDDGAGQITATLIRGDYDVFVIANAGGDTGELTREETERFSLSVPGESGLTAAGGLPMSARLSVSVSGTAVIPVSLVRCTAKVTLSLRVDEQTAGEIALQSVRVGDAPGTVALFSDNRAAESALIDYAKRSVTDNVFSGTFYIPENLQGVNASISDQRDKSAANAPAAATFLDIRAAAEGQEIAYRIYPGANNTTDFNLERNHHYVIDATIRGTNAIDTRVSTVKLSSGTLKNPCTIGETVPSNLTATCTNAPDRTIRLSVTILEGSATVRVDGAEWPSGVALPFCRGNETRTAAIALVSLRSGPLRIRYTLSDDNGYITSQEQSTYCKQIHPLTTSYTEQPWSGEAHTPLDFTVHAAQQNNTAGFTVRYELLQGSGKLYYNGVEISDGMGFSSGTSNPDTGRKCPFRFTPTAVGTARIRLTFIGDDGQTSVIDRTYADIKPYIVHLTPDYQVVRTGLATLGGTRYYRNLTVRVLLTADRPVPYRTSLTVSLYYTTGYYETTSSKAVITPMNTTAGILIMPGKQSGHTDLETYQGCCVTRSSGTVRVYAPGYYIKEKSGSTFSDPVYDARMNTYKLTVTPQDNSVECIVEKPAG